MGGGDLVEIAPSAESLTRGLYEYHLDFPGNALEPGCDFERWARRLAGNHDPVVYAHVATDPGFPGRLALQYWMFYAYNDWNNLHEGDWEMIQLDFDAATARDALSRDPVSVGYSQHEGAERADWGDDKLELVDGSHPVVHPAAGSHANFFGEALYLGSSAEQGVGCDDTRGPHLRRPARRRDDPERSRRGAQAVPLDRLPGTLGRAAARVLQRPDGAEAEGAVDRADPLVRALARAQLQGPGRERVRNERDGLLFAAPSATARGPLCDSSATRSR